MLNSFLTQKNSEDKSATEANWLRLKIGKPFIIIQPYITHKTRSYPHQCSSKRTKQERVTARAGSSNQVSYLFLKIHITTTPHFRGVQHIPCDPTESRHLHLFSTRFPSSNHFSLLTSNSFALINHSNDYLNSEFNKYS